MEEIQSSSQMLLGTLKERDSRECLKSGRNTVSAVSLHKGILPSSYIVISSDTFSLKGLRDNAIGCL